MTRAALLLALLVPMAVRADPSPVPPPDHHHIVIQSGEPAPTDGIFEDLLAARYDVERLRWYDAELNACKEVAQARQSSPFTAWLVGGAVGVMLGIAATGVVALVVKK